MYDMFFESTVNLCDRFTALDPVKVRNYPAHEIFLLFRRLSDYTDRHKKNENKVKRVQAGDDWF